MFNCDEALLSALHVFWRRGYQGATLTELTEAMGITKPSLYAAFGDKLSLFAKALDLYEREKLRFVQRALDHPKARDVAAALLQFAIDGQSSEAFPTGCVGIIHAVAYGTGDASVRAELQKRGEPTKDAIVARFWRAKEERDLPEHFDPVGLTAYLFALWQGIGLQRSAGAKAADLQRLLRTSLAFWPTPSTRDARCS